MANGNGADAQSLEFTWRYNPPVDPAGAERMLKEVNEILGGLGIVFLLSCARWQQLLEFHVDRRPTNEGFRYYNLDGAA